MNKSVILPGVLGGTFGVWRDGRRVARFKDYGDGGGLAWQLFPAGTTREDIERAGWDLEGFAGNPGQAFARGACIRETSTRVLVTQFRGLDI